MAEVDTSSYPKPPALPVQKSLLDQVGQYQSLESQKIGIDQQKLKLINDHSQLMTDDLATFANDPKATKEEVLKRMHARADAFNMPPQVRKMMDAEFADIPSGVPLAQNPALARKLDFVIKRSMDTNQKLNAQYGAPGTRSDGQTDVATRQGLRGPPMDVGIPIQRQIPPTTPVLGPDNQPTMQGPTPAVAAPGTATKSVPLPVARPEALPVGPRTSPAINGPSANFGGTVLGASVEPPTFNDRHSAAYPAPAGPKTGFAPGVAEAESEAGGASGKQLASDRVASAGFQNDITPLNQAIPGLEKLGPKGTGPGTDTINHLKSFILSNVPGIKETDPAFESVPKYDKVKKYLTQIATSSGSTGTNDKLAATFAGNPSVGISNAAASDVAKTILSLRRAKQATLLEFEQSNLPASSYASWVAKKTNDIDPRAFGVDLMSDDAKQKLLQSLNKNKKEKEIFERSLELAHKHNFITPPQAQ